MSEPVRCPACGATNAAAAQWCGQCLTRFGEPVAPTDPAASGAPAAPAAPAVTPPSAPPTLRPVPSAGVHRRDGDVFWTCPACEAVNEMSHLSCPRCGTPMAMLFGAEKSKTLKRGGPMVIVLSAALPGAGHGYAGRTADAIARGVLYVWTLAIGLYLSTRPSGRGAGVFRAIGAVFVISAAGTWLIAMLESQRLVKGNDNPLVPGKALLWASAALTGLLFIGLAAGARAR